MLGRALGAIRVAAHENAAAVRLAFILLVAKIAHDGVFMIDDCHSSHAHDSSYLLYQTTCVAQLGGVLLITVMSDGRISDRLSPVSVASRPKPS